MAEVLIPDVLNKPMVINLNGKNSVFFTVSDYFAVG